VNGNKATILGFGLVALVLGVGLLTVNATITTEAQRINSSINSLPAQLKRTVFGG
jgi:hypothetical protein